MSSISLRPLPALFHVREVSRENVITKFGLHMRLSSSWSQLRLNAASPLRLPTASLLPLLPPLPPDPSLLLPPHGLPRCPPCVSPHRRHRYCSHPRRRRPPHDGHFMMATSCAGTADRTRRRHPRRHVSHDGHLVRWHSRCRLPHSSTHPRHRGTSRRPCLVRWHSRCWLPHP
jgi:hypothetical protein